MNENPTAPVRYCDLVMKGGVTSGVVYPSAAAKLSEKFVFRNIGGTSAGAIAAAATAVAERARATGGFAKLGQLPTFLTEASPGGTGSNLFAFFQAQPETRKLFSVCVSALGGSGTGLRIFRQLCRSYPIPILLGALPGLLFIWGSIQGASGTFPMGLLPRRRAPLYPGRRPQSRMGDGSRCGLRTHGQFLRHVQRDDGRVP